MKFIGIIPARYASTRFPGKPLAILGGKPVVQRVYERVAGILDETVVATDDLRIYEAVKAFGGDVVMTGEHHRSGTDRCYEAYCNLGSDASVIINIQGDEPFIHPDQIEEIKQCFADPETQIATLVRRFDPAKGFEALADNTKPKVVFDNRSFALYFSRSVIPFVRGAETDDWASKHTYYQHVGMYAYRPATLKAVTALPPGAEQRSSISAFP